MKLIQRVLISILRRKTFTIVLFLFTFLFGNVMAVSTTIAQNGESLKGDLLQKLGGKVLLESELSSYNSANDLKDEDYDELTNTFFEIYYDLNKHEMIEYADMNIHFQGLYLKESESYDLPNKIYNDESYVHGVGSEVFIDEIEDKLALIEGEYFTKDMLENGENYIIIHNHVTKNGKELKIGDKISFDFVIPEYNFLTNENNILYKEEVEYTIIGIYQQIENKFSDIQIELENFYVPNNSILKYANKMNEYKNENNIIMNQRIWIKNCMLRVKSLDHFSRFSSIVENKTKDTGITSYSSDDTIEGLLGPIQIFSELSKKIQIFSLIAMCIISGLITFYFVRDRKYEIGIYLSLGMKKLELCLQIILETFVIGMLGILLSIGSGSIVSQQYSNHLMQSMVYYENSEKDKYTTGHEILNPEQIDKEEIINQYKVEITKEDISILILSGGLTLILSSALPLSYILRIKPKNILLD